MKTLISALIAVWIYSHETFLFDTLSGDLEPGNYAVTAELDSYVYRDERSSKQSEGFSAIGVIPEKDDPKSADELLTYIKVNIVGKAYYHYFREDDGSIFRKMTTADDYGKNEHPTK